MFEDIDNLRSVFLVIAVVCSVLFLWQLLAALLGFSMGEDAADGDMGHDFDHGADGDIGHDFDHGADGDVGHDIDHSMDHDGSEVDTSSVTDFKLLSIRSVISFFLLFGWAGFLYLGDEMMSTTRVMLYSVLWGVAAMVLTSWLFYQLYKLQESGNMDLRTCIGKTGEVYISIRENEPGTVRIMVSDTLSYVKARPARGGEIPAGSKVKVTGVIDSNTIEVEKA
ncbi:MAG: NfeD family protein [Planctomycetota bacterium]|nr:NfeD family protein [Planctomycetota bacterium]